MKRVGIFAGILFMLLFLVAPSQAFARKKKKEEPKEKISKYDSFLKKNTMVTARSSFLTLHKQGNKLFVEIPLRYLKRDMLLASTTAESSNSRLAMVGFKPNDPLLVRFEQRDSIIILESVNAIMEGDDDMQLAMKRNYINPVLYSYKINCYNNDSTAVVVDMTKLFTDDVKLLKNVVEKYSVLRVSSTLKKDITMLGNIKAFDDNATIETYMNYDYSLKFMGNEVATGELSTKMNRTFLLLPERQMKPRISDSRIGIFLTDKRSLSGDMDGMESYCLANRWRLEPKDTAAWMRGELVDPVKPIVWYVDDSFPQEWKEPLKQSVLIWNKAFEQIGFKNVMIARDFPKDDPQFDPDNLKYSCIRYVPIDVENAMGPSWVDPRTGEIINASVLVYNDVVKLINSWRFVQTSQVDPDVRHKRMPKEVLNASLTYVFSHEIGHTLGLMHNMAASAAVPVDSLRSVSFTQKYGTTPSIMDYARWNYVAQPEDKGVRLSPPDMGVYDLYAIKWLYSPIKGNLTPKEEARILEKWVDEKAGQPFYRYGKQQISARYDPSALEEDLGDDAMKAGDYGIKNLKYILLHLSEWIQDDESTAHRQMLYGDIWAQYNGYLMNALENVGGIYQTEIKDGTPGQRNQAVPKAVQQASLRWVVKQVRNSGWLDEPSLKALFPLGVRKSVSTANLFAKRILSLNNKVLMSSHISSDPYTQKAYYDDLYQCIWEPTIKGTRLTEADKIMQRQVITEALSAADKVMGRSASKSLIESENYAGMSLTELAEVGPLATDFVKDHLDELLQKEEKADCMSVSFENMRSFGDQSGYGFQSQVETGAIDESRGYYLVMLDKIRTLVRSRVVGANPDDKAHYQAILAGLKRLDK